VHNPDRKENPAWRAAARIVGNDWHKNLVRCMRPREGRVLEGREGGKPGAREGVESKGEWEERR
jgi:hypothetical protein